MFFRKSFYIASILLALFCASFPELAPAAESVQDLIRINRRLQGIFCVVLFFCFIIVCIVKKRRSFQKRPSGIGGWLTFFISFTMAGQIVNFCVTNILLLEQMRQTPEMQAGTYPFIAIYIIYSCFVLYALWNVCRLKPGARRLIKKAIVLIFMFDLTSPFISLVCLALGMGLNFSIITVEVIKDFYDTITIIHITRSLIYMGIWLSYFSSSLRVQNTWDEIEGVQGAIEGETPETNAAAS